MLKERTLPRDYIAPGENDVTGAFVQWARPLIGEELPRYFEW